MTIKRYEQVTIIQTEKWSRKQFEHSILICVKFVFDCSFHEYSVSSTVQGEIIIS